MYVPRYRYAGPPGQPGIMLPQAKQRRDEQQVEESFRMHWHPSVVDGCIKYVD